MDNVKRFLKNPISLSGLILLVTFIVIAIAAPWLAPPAYPDEPYRVPRAGWSVMPQAPSDDAPLGTTEGQYDIYYGLIWGTRTAFRVGLTIVGTAMVIGVAVGSLAAFYGGKLDELLMRLTDVFMAFPIYVAAVVLTALLGKSITSVIIALTAFHWMEYARMIRGNILKIRELEFVEAARASGMGGFRIILKHVIPNGIFPVLVQASMNIGTMVIVAAALSFLGLGAESDYASWGQLISLSRNWITGAPGEPLKFWYTLVYPSLAISLFVLAWNLVGDGLRDVMDPRLRSGR